MSEFSYTKQVTPSSIEGESKTLDNFAFNINDFVISMINLKDYLACQRSLIGLAHTIGS
jgi:hypothetical protein